MQKMKILQGYKHGSLVLYEVIPQGVIEFGVSHKMFAFDYSSLAEQWEISKETLDLVVSYHIEFKHAKFVEFKETSAGLKKTYLLHADVIPALLYKLKDSGQKPELNYIKQNQMVKELLDAVSKESSYNKRKAKA